MIIILIDKCLHLTLYGIYLVSMIISAIFAFSLPAYTKIETKTESKLFKGPTYGILEENISIIDDFMKHYHVGAGIVMVILCAMDFNACQYIIRFLNFIVL
ncbi:MAG: hypothetical protein ABSB18_02825 [Candidatus Omnitrophota bacterium]